MAKNIHQVALVNLEAMLTFERSMLDSKEKIDDISDPILISAYRLRIAVLGGVYTDLVTDHKRLNFNKNGQE